MINVESLWNVYAKVVPVVIGALELIPKNLQKLLGVIRIASTITTLQKTI